MDASWIVIGRVGAVYGVAGWNHIHSYTHPIEKLVTYTPLWLSCEKIHWDKILINQWKYRESKHPLIVHFENSFTREIAKQYTGAYIAIREDQLPVLSQDEYYWQDLFGLAVFHINGTYCGKVRCLFETGSNDVIVVQSAQDPKKEYWIPYLPKETIVQIDLKNKKMMVDWDL